MATWRVGATDELGCPRGRGGWIGRQAGLADKLDWQTRLRRKPWRGRAHCPSFFYSTPLPTFQLDGCPVFVFALVIDLVLERSRLQQKKNLAACLTTHAARLFSGAGEVACDHTTCRIGAEVLPCQPHWLAAAVSRRLARFGQFLQLFCLGDLPLPCQRRGGLDDFRQFLILAE